MLRSQSDLRNQLRCHMGTRVTLQSLPFHSCPGGDPGNLSPHRAWVSSPSPSSPSLPPRQEQLGLGHPRPHSGKRATRLPVWGSVADWVVKADAAAAGCRATARGYPAALAGRRHRSGEGEGVLGSKAQRRGREHWSPLNPWGDPSPQGSSCPEPQFYEVRTANRRQPLGRCLHPPLGPSPGRHSPFAPWSIAGFPEPQRPWSPLSTSHTPAVQGPASTWVWPPSWEPPSSLPCS